MRSFGKVLDWISNRFADELLNIEVELHTELFDAEEFSWRMPFVQFKVMVTEKNGLKGVLRYWLPEGVSKVRVCRVNFFMNKPFGSKINLAYEHIISDPLRESGIEKLMLNGINLEFITLQGNGVDWFLEKAGIILDIQREIDKEWLK